MPKKPHGSGHDLRNVRLQGNQCFACGADNGPPGHCHGGIIATILDEAMGKVNKLRRVIAMTSQMTVDYVRPVPLNKPLRVESREVSVRGRKHVNMGEILNQKGEVLARGRALFIAVDAQRMFARFVK
jgi:uncharacterized protein (TIGR00369 family)